MGNTIPINEQSIAALRPRRFSNPATTTFKHQEVLARDLGYVNSFLFSVANRDRSTEN
jgi:hypothetical protein